jgi:hypothetical protein
MNSGRNDVLCVVLEIAQPNGLDVLAAYSDGMARYISHTGKASVWEAKTHVADKLISQVFSESVNVVKQIEPWGRERKPPPKNGLIRISFLTSDGLYFLEGHYDAMHKDELAGPVIDSASSLLTFLMSMR